MEFNFQKNHTHQQHYNNQIFPTSSLTYTDDRLWIIERELMKERIREEILTEELERRRLLEAEVRRELELEHEMTARNGGYLTALVVGQPIHTHHYQFVHESRRIAMPVPEKYVDGGRLRRDNGGFEAVPFVGQSKSNAHKKEMIGLGFPSGSKRKTQPPPPAPPSKKEDFSCKLCKITAPSARGLEEHLSGRKHAKMVGKNPISKKKIKKGRKSKKGKKHKKPC